jgi:hypothetical protein
MKGALDFILFFALCLFAFALPPLSRRATRRAIIASKP